MSNILLIKNHVKQANALADALLVSDKTPVFDLDGVLLDASHRIKLHADGSLDLEHYRSNTTAEQVMRDKDLPLMLAIQKLNVAGKRYHVATARVLCDNTLNLLTSRGILPAIALGREGENDNRRDCELKAQRLASTFTPQQLTNMLLIDDHLPNCQAAIGLGMLAIQVERCTLA